jgi:sulfate transport system permease protein
MHERTGFTARLLIVAGTLLTALLIVAPLAVIFERAFSKGWTYYVAAISNSESLHAAGLTLLCTLIVVPLNVAFGLFASWTIARFQFRGNAWLLSLVELPLSVSPIVAGVCYVLLYGSQSWLGGWLETHDIRVLFSVPAIVLVTLFVTSPYVARELIPLMQTQGNDAEEVAVTLGASGWQLFRWVTLPAARWALLYGTVLCVARSIGEFGAVSVVSGNVRGETNTLPLHVELLFHDYDVVGAFAAATTLTSVALITLLIRSLAERRVKSL